MKIQDILSEKKVYWLGAAFVLLAVFAFLFARFGFKSTTTQPPIIIPANAIPIPNIASSTESNNIFNSTNFRKVQENYQHSYLNLVNKINNFDEATIDVKKSKRLFNDYRLMKIHHKKASNKVEEYSKDFKLKCFAKMRTVILAVLYYDRKNKKKMTRLDIEKLRKFGALRKEPKCPMKGKYSIIYKDGRRFFHCSVHGVLRN